MIKIAWATYNKKLIIFSIIVFIVLYIIPIGFIPDFFDFRSIESPFAFLIVLLSANASILGIVAAILVIVLNNFTQNYRRKAIEILIAAKWFKNTSTAFLLSILIPLFSIIVIRLPLSSNDLNLMLMSSITFIITLTLLFPTLLALIRGSFSLEIIEEIINKVDLKAVSGVFVRQHNENVKTILENIESNPIIILRELCVLHLDRNDSNIAQFIIIRIEQILIRAIKHELGTNKIKLDAFTIVLSYSFKKAIEKQDTRFIRFAFDIIKNTQIYFSQEAIDANAVYDFDDFTKTCIESIVKNDVDITFRDLRRMVTSIIEESILTNPPKEKHVSWLHIRYGQEFDDKVGYVENFDESQRWDRIETKVLYFYFDLLELAIEYKKQDLFKYTIWDASSIIWEIDRSDKLGQFQKEVLVTQIFRTINWITKKAIQNKLFEDTFSIDFFEHSHIHNWISEEKPYSSFAIKYYGDTIMSWIELGVFGVNSINNIAACGRFASKEYQTNIFKKKCLIYINNVLVRLEKIFSEDIHQWGKHYLELKKQVDYNLEYIKKEKPLAGDNVLKILDDLSGKMKTKTDVIDSRIKEKYVDWPEKLE